MMRLAVFVCTFGYVGYFPIAPGTVGSAAGLVVYALMRALGASPVADLAVIAVLFAAGVWSGTIAERHFGATDPGPGVIDEVVGMLVTLWALPANWALAIVGFFVFRLLDIIKPWPANGFERLHGGLGMMADDVMAAIYGNLLLRGALLLLPALGGVMQALRSAEIIAVGSELLTPTRIDTNSLAITDTLNQLGVDVRAKAIVGDRRADLAAVFGGALARVDLIVLCGGLGPTDDDLTREVVAEVLERPLREDLAITETIRARFARRNLTMPDINRRQAMVPDGGVVLANVNGTAPGLWIDHGDQVVVLLPGPPRELGPMLEGAVRQRLAARVSGEGLFTRVVRIFGRSESHTEEAVQPFYAPWAAGVPAIEVTILAARGAIDLHLTARARALAEASAVLEPAVRQAVAALGDDVYSDAGHAIEQVIGDLLRERGWHLAAAESCTGGLLLSRLTEIPGSSNYVTSGVVSYSNQSKVDLLGVDPALIDAHGAVSEPVAQAMAAGMKARSGAEVGIAITGIAGPAGGTEAKPVGTVFIALDTPAGALVRRRQMLGGRDLIRAMAAHSALDMLRRLLTGRQVPSGIHLVPAMPVVALSLGYLVGSIPFALLVGRLATGVDIRRAGSGNVGAANVLRTSGVAVAVCVLLLDMAKGAASVLWVARFTTGESSAALAGLAAVVGHVYPVWLRFRGGKGVATAAGVFSVLTPFAIGPAAVVFVITVWATRYISLGSVLATMALSPLAWATGASPPVTATAAAVGALIVFRHRSNIGRLRDGSERRIGQRVTS